MSLKLVLDFIHSIRLTVINKQNKSNSQRSRTNAYAQFLEHIEHLLQASEKENNMETLREAILMLEKAPIHSLFDNQKLGKLLADENHTTLIPSDQISSQSKSCSALPNKHQKMLMHIHQKLIKYFMFVSEHQKYTWSFAYKHQQSKYKKLNNIIDAWQTGRMILSASKEAAYNDYLRDFCLQGMFTITHTKSEIDGIIDDLIDNSNTPEEYKILVKNWLKANGGQDNNRFIDFLLQGGFIEIPRKGLTPAPTGYVSLDELLHPTYHKFVLLNAESFGQGWFLQNGQLCFTCDIVVYSLMHEKKKFIFLNPDKEPNQLGDQLHMTNDIDYFVPQQKNKKALLRFQAELALEIVDHPQHKNEKCVKPKMTFLNVTGYTHSLQSRYGLENLNELEQKTQNSACKLSS